MKRAMHFIYFLPTSYLIQGQIFSYCECEISVKIFHLCQIQNLWECYLISSECNYLMSPFLQYNLLIFPLIHFLHLFDNQIHILHTKGSFLISNFHFLHLLLSYSLRIFHFHQLHHYIILHFHMRVHQQLKYTLQFL